MNIIFNIIISLQLNLRNPIKKKNKLNLRKISGSTYLLFFKSIPYNFSRRPTSSSTQMVTCSHKHNHTGSYTFTENKKRG